MSIRRFFGFSPNQQASTGRPPGLDPIEESALRVQRDVNSIYASAISAQRSAERLRGEVDSMLGLIATNPVTRVLDDRRNHA